MKKINHKATPRSKVSTLLLACLVLVAVFSIMPISAYAETTIPDATSQFYVNDFADVFTAEEESRLMKTAVSLAEEHDGIQIVVTTIESLGGDTVENYALNMYNKYGIGKNDMGLLILLSTGDREIRVEVGRAMEAYVSDSKAGRFMDDYAIPYLAENKFNEGLINLQEAFVEEIISCVEKESAAVTTVPQKTEAATPVKDKKSSTVSALTIAGTLLAITMIVLVTIVVYKLTVVKNHKSEVDSLKEQLENEKQNNLKQKDSFKSQIKQMSSSHSREIDSFEKRLTSADERNQSLQQKYNDLLERFKRVETLHPEINQEISDMIAEENRQKDMAIAKEVDATLCRLVGLTASKDIVSKLEYALSHYSRLSESQKSYVTSDIAHLNDLYSKSKKLKEEYEEQQELKRRKSCAAAALTSITAIIACMSIGRARDLSSLRRAKSIYNDLDSGSRYYFDRATAEKLDSLLAQAERDQRRIDEEEAERRRREREESEQRRREEEERRQRQREADAQRRRQQSMHRSSSSFGGSRSHSGFGGRSGGGGAGRKF